MSNFIDEAERHAELYGRYNDRQNNVLLKIKPLSKRMMDNDELIEHLHQMGINDKEISWLKRTGHVLPIYR